MWNAREKGNTLIVRRKDKVPFEIDWSDIHPNCFEARKEDKRRAEREEELESERERRRMMSEMTEGELVEFKRAKEEERNRRDIFKFRGFTKAFTNFAKYIIAFIFAKFKYFAKQIIYLESPDHVLQNDI